MEILDYTKSVLIKALSKNLPVYGGIAKQGLKKEFFYDKVVIEKFKRKR